MRVYRTFCFELRFSEHGLRPTDEKVKAIKEAPIPRNVTELLSLLGMLAALTNFLPKLSTLAHPRYELMGNTPWNWSQSCEKVFCVVKCALTTGVTILRRYDLKLPV